MMYSQCQSHVIHLRIKAIFLHYFRRIDLFAFNFQVGSVNCVNAIVLSCVCNASLRYGIEVKKQSHTHTNGMKMRKVSSRHCKLRWRFHSRFSVNFRNSVTQLSTPTCKTALSPLALSLYVCKPLCVMSVYEYHTWRGIIQHEFIIIGKLVDSIMFSVVVFVSVCDVLLNWGQLSNSLT